jgi:uncharacterized protein YmfQ (DUF2313 family)
MPSSTEKILKLSKQLLPTGRAFSCPEDSNFEKLFLSLSEVQADALDSISGILDKILPDNENFTASDAARLEKILGVSSGITDTLEERKQALLRKVAFPRNVKGRQHKSWLQQQLREAGFNVTIYEYSDFKDLVSSVSHGDDTQHSYDVRHGGLQMPLYTGYVMNCANQDEEKEFSVTLESVRRCFYISGDNFSFIPITSDRFTEFRNIIMKTKPIMTVALLRTAPSSVSWILDTGYWSSSGYWFNTSTWQTA